MDNHAPFRMMTRRPLAGFSVLFGLGCALAAQFGLHPSFLFVAILSALAVAVPLRKSGVGLGVLLAVVFCAGLYHAGLYRQVWLDSLDGLSGPQHVELRGRLSGDPSWFERKGRPQTAISVFGRINEKERAKVRVVFSGHLTDTFLHGEEWSFSGRLYPYRHRGKYAGVMYVQTFERDARRLKRADVFFRTCQHLRHKGRELLGLGLNDFPQGRGLLQAMLLGDRSEVRGDLKGAFIDSGTLHLFALSGLHVAIIALVLVGALKFAGVTRPYWGLVLIPVLLVYVAMTGMRSSTLRAFVMASIYWGAPLVRRRPDALSALALAAFLILLMDPLQVSDPGFVLSFSVVGLLIVVCGRFREWLLPVDYEGKGQTFRWHAQFYMRSLVLSSSAAWMASFPLALFYFGRASLIGPLANLLAVPLSFLIVLTGGLVLLTGGIVPLGAEILNHANRIFLSLLCAVASFFADLPFGSVRVESMRSWQLACWYIGAACLLAGKQKSFRFFGAALLLVFAGSFFLGAD